MGRRAGVTADETRAQIVDAAAAVFARRGYEGASIAEITSEAGLSSGAIYAHYASKAELFIATLEAHTRTHVTELLGAGGANFMDALASVGATLDRRNPIEGSLLLEAIVAGRRDPEVGRLLGVVFGEHQAFMVALARESQAAGALDTVVTAEAVARFALVIALGTHVAAAIDLPPLDHDAWTGLITALVERARPH